MQKTFITPTLLLLFGCLFSQTTQAIWYESSGQAVIYNDNKALARQQATQEAIKQALMFAGASVNSIQTLANGLLQADSIEIRSAGEVNDIELIEEEYDGDIVTVRIRADIFAQAMQCRAADYQKTIVTTWYPIQNRQQATVGNLFDFGQDVARSLFSEFNKLAKSSKLLPLEPYYLAIGNDPNTAISLAKKAHAQYVLLAEIDQFSTTQQDPPSLAFWQSPSLTRDFGLSVAVFDGNTGDKVFSQTKHTLAPWTFDKHELIDSNSSKLWQSEFGRAVTQQLKELSKDIDETLSCLTAYGRVLSNSDNQIRINLGSDNGLRKDDKLMLFQMSQFFDQTGQLHQQYRLHPQQVTVAQVFKHTAIVISDNGIPLANIQANDFVARR